MNSVYIKGLQSLLNHLPIKYLRKVRKYYRDTELIRLFLIVSAVMGFDVMDIVNTSKHKRVSNAKDIITYLLKKDCMMPNSLIRRLLNDRRDSMVHDRYKRHDHKINGYDGVGFDYSRIGDSEGDAELRFITESIMKMWKDSLHFWG